MAGYKIHKVPIFNIKTNELWVTSGRIKQGRDGSWLLEVKDKREWFHKIFLVKKKIVLPISTDKVIKGRVRDSKQNFMALGTEDNINLFYLRFNDDNEYIYYQCDKCFKFFETEREACDTKVDGNPCDGEVKLHRYTVKNVSAIPTNVMALGIQHLNRIVVRYKTQTNWEKLMPWMVLLVGFVVIGAAIFVFADKVGNAQLGAVCDVVIENLTATIPGA